MSRAEANAVRLCAQMWVCSLRLYDDVRCSQADACRMMLRLHPRMFESDLRALLKNVSSQVESVIAETVRLYSTDESQKIASVPVVPTLQILKSVRSGFNTQRAVPEEVKLAEIGGDEADVDRCYDSYLLTVNGSVVPIPLLCVPKDTAFPCPRSIEDMDRVAAELLLLGASVVRLYQPGVHDCMTGVYNGEFFSLGMDGVFEHNAVAVAARRALL